MASTIKIKRSGVSGKQPNTASLSVGELAINYKDQKLYSSNGTSVFEIGSSSGGLVTTTTKAFGSLKGTDTVITGVTAAVSTNYLQAANAVATYATKVAPTTSGLLAHTGRATISTNLAVSGNVGIGTSSPSGRFHVRQDQDGVTRSILHNRNASGTPIVELDFITGAVDLSDSRYAYIQSGGGSSQYIAFGTGQGASPTERMRIDTAGRVTMPHQPAFYAYGSDTQSWFGAQGAFPVQLASSASLGNRNAAVYNTSTYRFTAPVAGLYYFYAQYATTTATSTGPESLLYINGSTDQYGSINYTNISFTTSSTTWIRYMNANDYAEFKIQNNNSTSFTVDLARSRFIGFLLG